MPVSERQAEHAVAVDVGGGEPRRSELDNEGR